MALNDTKDLSITEMNKLRAELGLAPLVDDSEELEKKKLPAGVDDDEEHFVDLQKIREEEEQKQYEKARRRSEKSAQQLKGPSLGELLLKDKQGPAKSAAESAEEWVQRSRKQEIQKKKRDRLLAERKLRQIAEEEEGRSINNSRSEERHIPTRPAKYDESTDQNNPLFGVAIAHRPEDLLRQGDEVILTLKDTNVLDESGDVLENIELVEEEKRRMNQDLLRKKSKYEELSEENNGSLFPRWEPKRSTDRDYMISSEGIIIQSGSADDEDVIKKRLREKTLQLVSEQSDEKKSSDYYTPEEIANMKRPRGIQPGKRKGERRKRAKRSLADILGDDADMLKDRGKRDTSVREKLEEMHQQMALETKQRSYEKALETASKKSEMILGKADGEPTVSVTVEKEPTDVEMKDNVESSVTSSVLSSLLKSTEKSKEIGFVSRVDNDVALLLDEDDVLYKSIAKARKKAINGRKKEMTKELSKVAERALESRREFQREADEAKTLNIDDTMGEDNSLIFTPMSEFTRIIKPPETSRRIAGVNENVEEEKNLKQTKPQANTDVRMKEEAEENDNIEEDEEDEEEGILFDEPNVALGLGDAVNYLSMKGDFKEITSADQIFVAGRKKDALFHAGEKDDQLFTYRDEKGRLLTKQETFRRLSVKFHGKAPGKKKLEKIARRDQEALARISAPSDDTANRSGASMRRVQEKTKQMYFDLSVSEAALEDTPSLPINVKSKKSKK